MRGERGLMMGRGYSIEKITIPAAGHGMKLLILRPGLARSREKTPGILWIHGGGYVTGMAGMVHVSRAISLVKKYGAVVAAPEYRLAGKAPYPAALEDCYAALKYIKENADTLGFNPDLLMVGGESAGGGLTAALCMYARDNSDIRIAFQMPLYPMLDDRDTDSSRNNHRLPWNTFFNHISWRKYLSGVKGEPPVYAAPARRKDFSNLPPCYTFVGDREPFYCETLSYVEKLKAAGVSAHVDVYPTGFHAFDMLTPFRRISKRAIAAFERQYLSAVEDLCRAHQNQGENK